MEPAELHRSLWQRVSGDNMRGRKIYLTSGALCMRGPGQEGEAGYYHPDPFGRGPVIWLWRRVASNVDDYAQEIVTLAHEYWHALSDKEGKRPRPIMPNPEPDLPDAEKSMVEAEEARAWAYGRRVLKELDPAYDFTLFDARKAADDAEYARRLGR